MRIECRCADRCEARQGSCHGLTAIIADVVHTATHQSIYSNRDVREAFAPRCPPMGHHMALLRYIIIVRKAVRNADEPPADTCVGKHACKRALRLATSTEWVWAPC